MKRIKLFGFNIWISREPLRVVHKDRNAIATVVLNAIFGWRWQRTVVKSAASLSTRVVTYIGCSPLALPNVIPWRTSGCFAESAGTNWKRSPTFTAISTWRTAQTMTPKIELQYDEKRDSLNHRTLTDMRLPSQGAGVFISRNLNDYTIFHLASVICHFGVGGIFPFIFYVLICNNHKGIGISVSKNQYFYLDK